MDDFYRAFEDRYRGSRKLIMERLSAYLPFTRPLLKHYPNAVALDLGCGRGEWLEVISEAGFSARGVDLDRGMLTACHERGLRAEHKDALSALREEADSSLAVISAFHVIEHIPFDDIRAIITEAMRALVPGGLLILETPNPENLVVATCSFYLDPTHERPIPPQLLSFLVEHGNFDRVKVVRLQEPEHVHDASHPLTLMSVLEAVSPDYSVIGQKGGDESVLEECAEVFAQQFGVSLEALAGRFNEQFELRARNIDKRLREVEKIARESAIAAERAANELHAVYTSKSWRITAPLRWVVRSYREIRHFGPRQCVKNTIKRIVIRISAFVAHRPAIKRILKACAVRLGVATRLQKIYRASHYGSASWAGRQPIAKELSSLTPRARHIHHTLKNSLKNQERQE